jgi:lysophospholipase L1-like esterase
VDYPLFRRILSAARDTVSGWRGKLYFAYLPCETDFRDRRFAKANEAVRRRVLGIVSELDIPLIDLRPLFAQEKDRDSLYAFRGAHLSPRGYQRTGLAIAAALRGDLPR